MDKQTIDNLKYLISENRLEEALDAMISREKPQGNDRYHTLILLKTRLNMLEEQEMAGLLDLDELMQQKLKISHSLLKMLHDKTSGSEPGESASSASGHSGEGATSQNSFLRKYGLLLLLFIVIAFSGIYAVKSMQKQTKPDRQEVTDLPSQPADQEQQTKIENDAPPRRESTREDNPDRGTRDVNQSRGKETEASVPEKNDEPIQENTTDKQTTPADREYRLRNFPPLNRPFNFGTIRYTFLDVSVEKQADGGAGTPDQLKLVLKLQMECRSNLGTCERETIRLLADGKTVSPKAQRNGSKWMDSNTTATDELLFIFDAGAKQYGIELERNKSTWKRSFEVY